MPPPNIRDRIRTIAFEQLGRHPEGLRFSHLLRNISLVDPGLNPSTINNAIWNLEEVSAEHVYKPARGLFRLKAFKDLRALEPRIDEKLKAQPRLMATKVNVLFAEWLEHELQDVEQAITPTNNLFNGLCRTPTVLGLAEAQLGGTQAPLPGIVSAQIESQTSDHIDAFGHACAARLFARRSYLVVPKRKRIEELMHLHALCKMFGLGLVLFDNLSVANPGFRLAVHAMDHDPDPDYASRCIQQLESAR
jgi:hypothetical protein